jgi:hypothetical protein
VQIGAQRLTSDAVESSALDRARKGWGTAVLAGDSVRIPDAVCTSRPSPRNPHEQAVQLPRLERPPPLAAATTG